MTLDVRYAMVAELDVPRTDRIRVLALWDGVDYAEPFEQDLAGTPCEGTSGREATRITAGAWRAYPQARFLVEGRIESFISVALYGADGQKLGYLAVMDDVPLGDDASATSILRVFAARAGAEIERSFAEDALAREKDRAQVTLASIGDGVIRTDAE